MWGHLLDVGAPTRCGGTYSMWGHLLDVHHLAQLLHTVKQQVALLDGRLVQRCLGIGPGGTGGGADGGVGVGGSAVVEFAVSGPRRWQLLF